MSDDAAATLFIAGISACLATAGSARVLGEVGRFDLYAPGLQQASLALGRVILAEGREDKHVSALMEDALRHAALVRLYLERAGFSQIKADVLADGRASGPLIAIIGRA